MISRMKKVVLSHSSKDESRAKKLEQAMIDSGIPVWRYARDITPGKEWFDAIDDAIRDAKGLVILITVASNKSEWVTYEYATARSGGIPVIAVVVGRANVPAPLQRFQMVRLLRPKATAMRIKKGLRAHPKQKTAGGNIAPGILASFQEEDGELVTIPNKKPFPPALGIDLWMENIPIQTTKVAFEIQDKSFPDPIWTVRRLKRDANWVREFLTDDFNSYGGVDIRARGIGSGMGSWSVSSTLYAALSRYYRGRRKRPAIRRALIQIKNW